MAGLQFRKTAAVGYDQAVDALTRQLIPALLRLARRSVRAGGRHLGGVERGAGDVGQKYVALPDNIRHAVREQVRREIGDTGGPIEVEVETGFAGGRR